MEPLVAVFVSLRRTTRRALPLLGIVLLGAVVALAGTQPVDARLFGGFVLICLVILAIRARKRAALARASYLIDVEIGSLLLITAYAVALDVDRSLDGSYYALVYVAIGVLSAFARPTASLTVIAAAMLYEASLRAFVYEKLDGLLPHAGFALVFGLLNTVSLRMEVARLRRAAVAALDADRDRMREQARSYRLLRAPSEGESRRDDVERLTRSGVEEITHSVLLALRLLRESLGAYTAMLLWLDDDGQKLRIGELASDDPDLNEGPFAPGDGILGAALAQAAPLSVEHLKPSYVLPYYRDACPVRAACAMPVYEHGVVRGVLIVDRLDDVPFDARQQTLVEQAARFIARVIENERVFVQLERTKVEQGKLYRAAERLGAAISEEEVVDAGVSAASEIAAVDFAAFTAYDASSDSHQIRAVSGASPALIDQRFKSNTGLVSMALKNRHPLPYRGEYDPSHQVVFTKRLAPPPMPSLLVLPLWVHDQPLGTLVLASRETGAFHDAARNLLEVLASHLAVSLSNARMVKRLEEQATTDGLTGLLNKRALLETATEKLRAARRFGRRLSVLIADIDHFKDVNDTHGHDIGDVVIKGLAQIHQTAKRNTDAVARFGGEEFVTVCEETDAAGALLLAERIRSELEKTSFHSGGMKLRCTCSIGIATFPEAGSSWEDLFKAADAALYASKRAGRNRTTVYRSGSAPHAA
ncbi:MAG TPA: sensor domain-containing diguanylate cyclase [Polyangiaceae bacterium]|nr:sensor domain-containing diguanylate cyclase [Polyangiaceae bacterium]